MNILIDDLPKTAIINGSEYKLNTDFRNCLKIILAFEDVGLTLQEKYYILLKLLYVDIPDDASKAIELGVFFLNCGEEDKESLTASDTGRVFSFQKDSRFIYTAIRQSHSIDLEGIDYLHWWKFCYLFSDIREDCFFSRVVYLRYQKEQGKLTKEEREYCSKIKEIIDLPKEYTQEEVKTKNKFIELLNS